MSISLLFPIVTEQNAGREVNFDYGNALNTLQLLFSQAVGPDDHCRTLPTGIVCSIPENKQECCRN